MQRNVVTAATQHAVVRAAAGQHEEPGQRNGVPAVQREKPVQRNAVPAAVQHGGRERPSEAGAAVQHEVQLLDAERRRPSVFQAELIRSLLPRR